MVGSEYEHVGRKIKGYSSWINVIINSMFIENAKSNLIILKRKGIEMNDRSISFEKISNARDMGGLRTVQGCLISSGFLIRSANLSNATEADRNVLREKYHLSKIIDLRTKMERNAMPDVPIADVDYLLTNRVNEAKSERYYQMMLSADRTETEAESIRDIFLAKEEYLNAAFSAMDTQYENAGAFLRDGLNIPRKLIERFQSSVL